jgi:hypothetical protein
MTVLNAAGTPQHSVLVAVPCGDEVKAGFAQDLALMMAYTTYVRPAMTVHLAFLRGTYLPRARAGLVQHALDRTATHILWLDSDMRFPKDTLLRLLDHAKPVVAANYPTRVHPIIPTTLDRDRVELFGGEGLVEVRTCGMGVMLTAIEVFQAIGRPWFALGYNRGVDDYSGEDTYFCERARASGFPVLVDAALSEHVAHLGEFAYGMDHARMTRDAALAERPQLALVE